MIADWITFAVIAVIIIAAVIGICMRRKKGNRINYNMEDDNGLDDFINSPD